VRAPHGGHPEGSSRHEGEPVGRGPAHHDAVDGLLQSPDPDQLDRGRVGGGRGGAGVLLGKVDLDDLDLGGEAAEGVKGRAGQGLRKEARHRGTARRRRSRWARGWRRGADRDGGEWAGDARAMVDNLIMYALVRRGPGVSVSWLIILHLYYL
jgi:hypothetical protein